MRINERGVDGAAVLELSGKLAGFSDSEALMAAVRGHADAGRRLIVADLDALSFVDADGIATLIHCGRLVRASGGRLCLVGLTRRIDDLVVIAALATEFEVYDTVTGAIGRHTTPERSEAGALPVGRPAVARA